jgi:hypothetical protein
MCLKQCIEMGMHPHFSIPACALDPATNYVQSLASYVKSNAPSWMVPYFEPGNEVWNTATTITTLVSYHAFQYRGNNFDWDNWYGKVLSTTGQDLAAIFGTTIAYIQISATRGGSAIVAGTNISIRQLQQHRSCDRNNHGRKRQQRDHRRQQHIIYGVDLGRISGSVLSWFDHDGEQSPRRDALECDGHAVTRHSQPITI